MCRGSKRGVRMSRGSKRGVCVEGACVWSHCMTVYFVKMTWNSPAIVHYC